MPEKDEAKKKKKASESYDERYEVKDKLTVKLADLFKSLGSKEEGKSPNELFRVKNKLKF
jgi:hypothetical protein